MFNRPGRNGVIALVGAVWISGLAAAQQATTDPLSALRPTLQVQRPIFTPDAALWLRFTLVNMSDEPVAIPLERGAVGDAVALPLELMLGSGQRRVLSVTFENEAPKEVPPQEIGGSASEGQTLRLAPRGVLGADVDLRKYFPGARYPGSYKVEWRPFGAGRAAACVEFRVEARKDAILITDVPGKITFTLDYENAPQNVDNFLDLVRQGFYTGKTFHRVIPGYLIQGGCPKGDGTGIRPDGKFVPAEFHNAPIDVGTLVMARKPSDPNSASCQFLIALGRLPELDGQYTVIGQAHDPDSLRTLQQLAAVATDARDRPVTPLIIRSINLADAEPPRSR